MALVPRFKSFTREDFRGAPDWFEPLFLTLNEVMGGLVAALSGRLTRADNFTASDKTGAEFAAPTFHLKNFLATKPKHFQCTKLERIDGAAISAAWSMTWAISATDIVVTFQGLTAGDKYRASFIYE